MMHLGAKFVSIQQQQQQQQQKHQLQLSCTSHLLKRHSVDSILAARSGAYADCFMASSDFTTQLPTISECAEEFFGCSKHGREAQPKSVSVCGEGTCTESSSGFSADSNVAQGLYVKARSGYRPRAFLSLFSSFCSCWQQHRGSCSQEEELPSVAALVELSRKQHEELAEKRDTIDMLEWQLQQLQEMARREHELQDDVRARPFSSPPLSPGFIPTELLFQMACVRSTISIRFFCKVFMKQMESSGFSIWRALADLEPKATFLRKEHTAFALESRINRSLFHCFEYDSFDESNLAIAMDPCIRSIARLEQFKRLKLTEVGDGVNPNHSSFDADFFRFCESKTRELWALFPWSITFKTSEERASFTASFLDAAKGVWLLHKLAFSMNPEVGITRVGRCMELNPSFVEAVVDPPAICSKCQTSRVEFMITPGFRCFKPVKCQVYPHLQCK